LKFYRCKICGIFVAVLNHVAVHSEHCIITSHLAGLLSLDLVLVSRCLEIGLGLQAADAECQVVLQMQWMLWY